MWWYEGGSGAWLAMTLSMVVFWGLVIWAILAVVRTGADDRRSGPRTPEEILAQRFARGEIDENEYRHRVEVLRAAQPSSSIGHGP